MTGEGEMEISASLEDYLEAIFLIIKQKQAARAKDISKWLNVGRSSVTGALHALAERNLINYAPYDVISLTDKGRAVAQDVLRRHEALKDFFVRVLAVGESDADAAACRMEHAIPEGVLQRFVAFVEFVDRCPRGGARWIRGFSHQCEHDQTYENCERCIGLALEDLKGRKMTKTEERTSTTLASLSPGQRAEIIKISGGGEVRRRLLDMGATTGSIVEVERVAPLGDPVEVKIKGYHLTLRMDEAKRILVEKVRQ